MTKYYFTVAMPWGAFSVTYSHKTISHVTNSNMTILETSLSGSIPDDATHKDWPTLRKKLEAYAQGQQVQFTESVSFEDYPRFTGQALEHIYTNCKWGQTLTYKEVAQGLNNPKAARAVGQAMARNRVPLIVP